MIPAILSNIGEYLFLNLSSILPNIFLILSLSKKSGRPYSSLTSYFLTTPSFFLGSISYWK